MTLDEKLLERLTRDALADNDPLGAVDRLHAALRARIFRAALEVGGWSMNGAAKVLRRTPSTVMSAIYKHHPKLADEANRRGPGRPPGAGRAPSRR